MFPIRSCALLAGALVVAPAAVLAQPAAWQERIAASYLLALGRSPTAAETDRWAREEPVPLAALVDRHRRQLEGDAGLARAVVVKAGQDAFGRAPSEDQVKGLAASGATYTDLVQRHLKWLAEHAVEYEQVVHNAYRLVLQREAYSVEIDYWKRQPTLSFALLAACIEDWARRNRPGLTATSGVPSVSMNSEYLDTVRLSPTAAAEARVIAGMAPAGDAALAYAAGRNVVAAGAEQIASVGGIYFAAAGAATLSPAQRQDRRFTSCMGSGLASGQNAQMQDLTPCGSAHFTAASTR